MLPVPASVRQYNVANSLFARFQDQRANSLAQFRENMAQLWGQEGWTVADAQAVIDLLDVTVGPGTALQMFGANYALGQVAMATNPGEIEEAELSSPVPYTLDGTRIVLDPAATYPTES